MSEEAKVVNQPKRARFAEKSFRTYEDAKAFQAEAIKGAESFVQGLVKAKVFRRSSGLFDVVLYQDIKEAGEQVKKSEAVLDGAVQELKKVHGLKSKERKQRRAAKK